MIVGASDEYSFEIRHPDGRVTRVVKEWEPVRVLPEERAEYEAANEWMRKNEGQFMMAEIPAVPATKAAYSSISAAADGRIWVRPQVQAEKRELTDAPRDDRPPPRTWREPLVYDVFESDGTYLGVVHPPPRTTLHWMGRDYAWGVARGEMNESYVVKLRITHAADSAAVARRN